MSTDGTSNDNADTLATNLFDAMTVGADFSIPTIDLDLPEFQIPDELSNDLYADVSKLTEADLTQRFVGGDGMFDGLMEAVDGHLDKQYKSNRLTGEQYASAYVQLTQAVLGNAVQYLLSKDSSYYQAQLAQKQAQMAEVGVVIERAKLETAKVGLATAQIEAESAKAQYALNKMQLANADIQYSLGQAQVAQTEYQTSAIMPAQLADAQAGTAIKDYQRTSLMPAELAQMSAQTSLTGEQEAAITKDIAVKAYQLTNLMPKELETATAQINKITAELDLTAEQVESQRAQTMDTRTDGITNITGLIGLQKDDTTSSIALKAAQELKVDADTSLTGSQKLAVDKEVDIKAYQLLNMLPVETSALQADVAGKEYTNQFLLPKQLEAASMDISVNTARKDQLLYQNANILPAQKGELDADIAIKSYQLTDQLPAQTAGVQAETIGKTYNNDFLLPAQLKSVTEQTESHRGKTMDTRIDGVTPITGSVGKQKELHQQQIDSYKRDSEHKVAKMLLETWTVQKSIDEGLVPPHGITNENINPVLDHLRDALGMPAQTTAPA